jgi:outer membrane receptor for ferrienterochelin and colicin
MLRKKLMQLVLAVLFLPAFAVAQTTTSGLSGTVKTNTGEALVGATVTAIHVPTGSVYKVQSRIGGRFDISNMNPGGPYSVEVSFVNFTIEKKSDIYLSLGESFKIDFALVSKADNLKGVTVTATKKTTEISGKGGTETTISPDKMANLPTVGRNLTDFLRAVPQAKLSSANSEGITIAGQNPRYNSFYVDGALNNDVFGLANSGTNGGQTSTPPLSIDAIDQFQVVISPYDASLGNFTGGGINAITKSGTNTTKGSVYYFFRNQDLAGKTPTGDKELATKFADFQNKTYGFSVGGPIIKNKVFYFINAETQRDERPQPFDVSNNYQGLTKTPAQIQRLRDTLAARGGYDPGTYFDNPERIEAERIATRIDWSINNQHKLSVSYRYTKADRYNTNTSSTTAIQFGNNGWLQPNRTHSVSAELKSIVGKSGSNKFLLTYTNVSDDRGPIGSPYPRIIINDGTGTNNNNGLLIGPDPSSNINVLLQKNWSIIDVYKVNIGKHVLSIGGEWEYNDVKNAFVQRTWGEYWYDSLAQFYANARPRQFRTAYSLLDGVASDATDAAAKFKIGKVSFFINDEIRVNDNISLNFGLRADYYKWLSIPTTDAFTNNVAIPKFAALYDMQGAQSGQAPTVPVSISPRFGFTYKIPEENIVVRGGVGLFTGRIPLVWPGGVFNNNGLFLGGYIANSGTNAAAWNNVRFRSNPYGQWTAAELGIGLNKGGLNLISEKFRNPRIFRTSIGIDKKLGNGWTSTFEGLFSKNISEVYYTNLNAQAPIGSVSGAGFGSGRLVYNPSSLPLVGTTNPYDNAILLTNNQGPKGFAYNLALTVDKRSRDGFNFNFNYSYGNSVVTNEATSSVNLSQWQFMETVNGRNNLGRSNSDFSAGHRIFTYISKKFTYAKKSMATTISLVYTGQSGSPFSYVYSGAFTRDDANAGGSGGNDLIYIPSASEMNRISIAAQNSGSTASAPARDLQISSLNSYIGEISYLNQRRGQFAERNGSRLPFTNIIDLKIAQDFNVKVAGHRYQFQITYDVFNFGNMLNRDWGRNYFLNNDQIAIMTFRGYTTPGNLNPTNAQISSTYGGVNTQPVLQFNPSNIGRSPWNVSTSSVPSVAARWISQLGVRFNF